MTILCTSWRYLSKCSCSVIGLLHVIGGLRSQLAPFANLSIGSVWECWFLVFLSLKKFFLHFRMTIRVFPCLCVRHAFQRFRGWVYTNTQSMGLACRDLWGMDMFMVTYKIIRLYLSNPVVYKVQYMLMKEVKEVFLSWSMGSPKGRTCRDSGGLSVAKGREKWTAAAAHGSLRWWWKGQEQGDEKAA